MTSSWSLYHITVFVLTFVSYAFFHATRKTFSNVKATISQEWTPAPDLLYNDTFHNGTIHQRTLPDKIWNSHNFYDNKNDAEYFLGDLDTAFLIAYAVGLFISGIVGDRLNMRLVLSFGMCSSAVAVFLFGTLSEWLHLYSKEYYLAMWIVNGLLQSTGWPTVVAIMANWFGKSSRGVVLGLWSACASVGNIIGAFIVAGVLQYGYEYAFLVPSIVLFAGGIVVFFGLVASPKEVGLPEPDENVIVTNNIINQSGQPTERDPLLQGSRRNESITEVDEVSNEPETSPEPKAIGFFQAFLLPGVILYSSSYACLKMVNYAFFFWLPYYLTNQFGWSQARSDELSIWYDVGGIVGGTIGGFVSDRMTKRSPTVMFMLLLSIPLLYFYSISPNDKTINAFLMSLVGFGLGGAANIISSAITADLGKQDSLRGNTKALATVTGIVDGTGSVGAAIGQFLVPIIQLRLNWHWVFYFFILMTILTMACILPLFIGDIRSMSCWRRRYGTPGLQVNIDGSTYDHVSDHRSDQYSSPSVQ